MAERFLDFAVGIIKLATKIDKTSVGRHIAGQLTRSATSAGANYQEACGAESKKDFVHKLQVVLKELRESSYWLKLIKKAELISEKQCDSLMDEAVELTRIIAKSVVTAKSRR
ncbi:MAG: four helix bundle protein [Candidatus Stahlbacteria bacterium]|nr:MAG: four helix bundle protein [Candidatus Stahlbacteria bacterium]